MLTRDRSISAVVRHYNSLFTFPRYYSILALIAGVTLLGSVAAFSVTSLNGHSALAGFTFGLQALFLPTMVVDILIGRFLIRDDPIFDVRRSAGLSLIVCCVWAFSLVVGVTVGTLFSLPDVKTQASVFCFGSALALRYLALKSISQLSKPKITVSILTQPLLCLLSSILVLESWSPDILARILLVSSLMVLSMRVFMMKVDQRGIGNTGVSTLFLLRGFVSSWIADLNQPLEEYLSQLGRCADIEFSLFAFKNRDSDRIRSTILVPILHPGPFRNVGSSNFPHIAQSALEKRLGGIAAVPHGCSGHGLDLASQSQNKKVLDAVLEEAARLKFDGLATEMVRIKIGSSLASCQIFGKHAFITLSRSPMVTEDIPHSVGRRISERARTLGLETATVIDTHNSIGTPSEPAIFQAVELEELEEAAIESIRRAASKRKVPFRVGVARTNPQEFGVSEGLGPAGIVVLAVEVSDQRAAYVIIDGNNMVRGYREEILKTLFEAGFDDGEIMTTDTHVVNGRSLTKRGYHPVGESIDRRLLTSYIRQLSGQAAEGFEQTEIAARQGVVKSVEILGEENTLGLSAFVDTAFKYSRSLALRIFPPTVLAAGILSYIPF